MPLGLGLLCGTFGTLLSLQDMHADYQDMLWGADPPGNRMVYSKLIEPLADAFKPLASDYKFFPTFAGLGLLGFFVRRWRNFFFAAWRVEGRIKDMSIMFGSAVADTQEPQATGFAVLLEVAVEDS